MTPTEALVQNEIISDDEVAVLNAARSLAKSLASRVQQLLSDPRVRYRTLGSDTPSGFELGILYENFGDIDEAIFQALNVTQNYGHAPLTGDQVHNR